MKLLGRKEQKELFWIAMSKAGIFMYVLLGVILGGVLGAYTKSWFVFLFCFIGCAVVAPVALARHIARRQVEISNKTITQLNADVMKTLKKVDYVATSMKCAIAVDVNSRLIAIVSADAQMKIGVPVLMASNKIKTYEAFQPGHTIIETLGQLNAVESAEKTARNLAARAAMYQESGLYFDLDDIMTPKLFAQMEYSDAEKWLLIIEKLLDGSLEPQLSPLEYPVC